MPDLNEVSKWQVNCYLWVEKAFLRQENFLFTFMQSLFILIEKIFLSHHNLIYTFTVETFPKKKGLYRLLIENTKLEKSQS